MFIVLEGCDNTGKTTLARRLCQLGEELYGWDTELWHRGVPQRHPLEEYIGDIDEYYDYRGDLAECTLIVADRWHLGQIVYGGLYRDKENRDLLDDYGINLVNNKLRAIGAVQYILHDDVDKLVQRELDGKEEDWQTSKDAGYLKTEHFGLVNAKYEELSAKYGIPLMHGFVDDDGAREMLAQAQIQHALSGETRQQPSNDEWRALLS